MSKYNLAIEVDEKGHKDKNFNFFVEIGKIQNYIVKLTKKLTEESAKENLTDKLSNNILRLDFKSNNSIKTRFLKYVAKKILPNL